MKKELKKYNLLGKMFIVVPAFTAAAFCYVSEKLFAYVIDKTANLFIK